MWEESESMWEGPLTLTRPEKRAVAPQTNTPDQADSTTTTTTTTTFTSELLK